MKTLLHDKNKGLYFKGISEWTNQEEAAFDFRMAERAVKFVRDANLPRTEMELILAFDRPEFNVAIPLDQRFETRPTAGY